MPNNPTTHNQHTTVAAAHQILPGSGPNAARTGNSPPFISTWEFNHITAWAEPPQLNPNGSRMTVRDQCNARFKAWNDAQEVEPPLSPSDLVGVVQLPATPTSSSSLSPAATATEQSVSSSWSSPPPSPLLVSRWSAESSILEAASAASSKAGTFGRFVDAVKHSGKPSREVKSPIPPAPTTSQSDVVAAAARCPISPGFDPVNAVPIHVAQADVARYGRSGALGSPLKCTPAPRDAVGEVLANGTVLIPLGAAQANAAAYGLPDFAIDAPLSRKWSSAAATTSPSRASVVAERQNTEARYDKGFVPAAVPSRPARSRFSKFKDVAKFVLTKGDVAMTPEFTMVTPRPQPARIVIGDASHSTVFGDLIDAANGTYKQQSLVDRDARSRSPPAREQVRMPDVFADVESLPASPSPSMPSLAQQPLRVRRRPRFVKALPPVLGQDISSSERARSCAVSLQHLSCEIDPAISSWTGGSFSDPSMTSDSESNSEPDAASPRSGYEMAFCSHAKPSAQIPESSWSATLHSEAARLKAVLQRPDPGEDGEPAITIDVDFQDGKTVWLVTERTGADTIESYRNRYTTVVPDNVSDVAEATELLRKLLELGL